MNDVIYAGYYTIEMIENAEHTYAIGEMPDGEKIHFACYGRTSGEGNTSQDMPEIDGYEQLGKELAH
jgi:hypothetical protein